jgi:hypothetical protein
MAERKRHRSQSDPSGSVQRMEFSEIVDKICERSEQEGVVLFDQLKKVEESYSSTYATYVRSEVSKLFSFITQTYPRIGFEITSSTKGAELILNKRIIFRTYTSNPYILEIVTPVGESIWIPDYRTTTGKGAVVSTIDFFCDGSGKWD